jgi:AcrR family transcriptional regulator
LSGSTRGRESHRAPLRVRKRNRTRRDLQRAAIDLVETNGYPATSVDEICDRAEVSRSTFFRYFGSKDAVFGSDILEEELIALLDAPGPPSLKDLEDRICAGLAALPAEDWDIERRRMHLLRTVPELRTMLVSEAFRPFPPAIRYVARMLGLPADSLRVRTVAGAVIGALAAQQVPDAEGEYELPASAQDAIARYRATFRELEQILDLTSPPD